MKHRQYLVCFLLALTLPRLGAAQTAFERRVIDPAFENGYQVTVADIDQDGLTDVVALSTNPSQLKWYRNPTWQARTITTQTQANIDAAPYDIDGDGDLDFALASGFSLGNSREGGEVYWAECPEDPASKQEWPIHFIDAIPTSHRLRWANLDGSGRPVLLNLPIIGMGAEAPLYDVPLEFVAYTLPTHPKTDPWTKTVIDNALELAHALSIVAWDDDAADEVLTASFDGVHLYNRTGAGIQKTHVAAGDRGQRPKQGSSEVALGKGADGKPFIATIEPWHGHQVVVYVPAPESQLWARAVIDDQLNDGHALAVADFDSDGTDEIVAGSRGKPYGLYLFDFSERQQTWTRRVVDEGGCAAAGIVITDLDEDGFVDIVATGTATNNVVWYRNEGTSSDSASGAGGL